MGYIKKNATKRLAAIAKLALDVIPQDPTNPEYCQGGTLGEDHKHWFRAKFFQQYRLFFRYHGPSRVIVLAWVNDEDSKRAYESGDDAYRVFRKMLASGHPLDDWDRLLKEARSGPRVCVRQWRRSRELHRFWREDWTPAIPLALPGFNQQVQLSPTGMANGLHQVKVIAAIAPCSSSVTYKHPVSEGIAQGHG